MSYISQFFFGLYMMYNICPSFESLDSENCEGSDLPGSEAHGSLMQMARAELGAYRIIYNVK